ncbi:MAG: iron ABC transporter permease [Mesorhizobium sp.]|nr:iron ABC transporter permease [Mesorhizobium sp.]MBN9245555.1 iron ABC transporter permease [Mesorhizobium sp.]
MSPSEVAAGPKVRTRGGLQIGLLVVAALVAAAGAACIGRYQIDIGTLLRVLGSRVFPIEHTWPETVETVLFEVRLPRIAISMLIGAALSASGVTFQGIFRNPLVSPFILGVSGGAGFGAAVAILLDSGSLGIQLSAFSFGALAVVIAVLLSRAYSSNPTLVLVLSGIITGGIFTALLGLLKYSADPEDKLPVIEFWLLGSLSASRASVLLRLAVVVLPALLLVMALRWRLNLLVFGDETAKSLGVNVTLERFIHIALGTLLASASVAVCGIVGWVGLVVPHLARLLVGPDHVRLVPVSLLLGAIFLLAVDTVARTLTAAEIPLGIVTALLGAPVFAILLRRGERSWM